jgi:phosphoribosylglycinamide formyltransferase-1
MNDRVAIFASGAGTTLDYLCRAQSQGELKKQIVLLITNNIKAGARTVAQNWGVQEFVTELSGHGEDELLKVLAEKQIGFIFLVGYLKKVGPKLLEAYRGRIFNSHPSLLPKYGGKGMYGRHVTEAVLAAKEKVTGVTIHRLDGEYDTGAILQQRELAVTLEDTVEALEDRVKATEKKMILDFLNGL